MERKVIQGKEGIKSMSRRKFGREGQTKRRKEKYITVESQRKKRMRTKTNSKKSSEDATGSGKKGRAGSVWVARLRDI